MKKWISLIGLPAVAAFLVCLPVWAQDAAGSDGHVSEMLANQMYCSVGGLLEGDVGLLLGLVLVFMGIWAMVQGAKIVAVLPVIIIGALVTALPSLIASSFGGLGTLLVQAGISKASAGDSTSAFSPPPCNGTDLSSAQLQQLQNYEDDTRKIEGNDYLPPTANNAKTPEVCPPGAGGSACQ